MGHEFEQVAGIDHDAKHGDSDERRTITDPGAAAGLFGGHRTSIEKLGFRWSDTKILLNSQAHFDHVGGAAEILRQTHAENMVMEGDVDVVESGNRFPRHVWLAADLRSSAHVDRVLRDGETVTLGGIALTAHKTAGHTRGCTTWTLRSHIPGEPLGTLRNIVIVGGVSFWSDFHFVDRLERPASYPGIRP
jgi:metallo-beta-lactamase class B